MNFETRIPSEILSEIFHLLCDEPIDLGQLENSACLAEFPWAVGQVCRRWRTAFLSSPVLWSCLSLLDPRVYDLTTAYLAEMERRSAIYLKRSGQHPLTLTICTDDSPIEGSMVTVFNMLLSCSDRWRKAAIVLPLSSSVNGDALLECRGRMPILESLLIDVYAFKDSEKYLNVFEIAPRLTEVNLRSHYGCTGRWTLPWIQLTKLRMSMTYHAWFTHGTVTELRAFLSQLQNVEELEFLLDDEAVRDSCCPPVHLPRLRLLGISILYPGVISWFQVPLLEHLLLDNPDFKFEDGGADPYHLRDELISLMDRSSCRIRQLTLRYCNIEQMHNAMETLANVEELYIESPSGRGVSAPLMETIAESDDYSYLLNLRVLQVKCPDCPQRLEELVEDLSFLIGVRMIVLEASDYNVMTLHKSVIEDRCKDFFGESRTPESVLKAMSRLPSFPQTVITEAKDEVLSLMFL